MAIKTTTVYNAAGGIVSMSQSRTTDNHNYNIRGGYGRIRKWDKSSYRRAYEYVDKYGDHIVVYSKK